MLFFDAECLINGTTYIVSMKYSVISNDLEWLSKIFNDTKRRAVSLRQLSFLLQKNRVSVRFLTGHKSKDQDFDQILTAQF